MPLLPSLLPYSFAVQSRPASSPHCFSLVCCAKQTCKQPLPPGIILTPDSPPPLPILDAFGNPKLEVQVSGWRTPDCWAIQTPQGPLAAEQFEHHKVRERRIWRVGQNHTYKCIYDIYTVLFREITIHTVIFGVHIRTVLCTWRLTASMVNDADGIIYVKLTVKIVNYAVNCQSLVTVTSFKPPLFTVPFLNDAVCAQHCIRIWPTLRIRETVQAARPTWWGKGGRLTGFETNCNAVEFSLSQASGESPRREADGAR
jgi:hypothetical protein